MVVLYKGLFPATDIDPSFLAQTDKHSHFSEILFCSQFIGSLCEAVWSFQFLLFFHLQAQMGSLKL